MPSQLAWEVRSHDYAIGEENAGSVEVWEWKYRSEVAKVKIAHIKIKLHFRGPQATSKTEKKFSRHAL